MSEYLNEEEQIARMKSWWDENGTTVIVSVVVAVATIIGWRWYDSNAQEQAYEGSRAYANYQAAPLVDKPAAAEVIAREFTGSAYHVFVLFQQAKAAIAEGDLSTAETHLIKVTDVADDELLVDLAKVRLAKIQYGLDRSSEALATLASLSNEGFRAWGLEAKGDIHVSRGEIELAHAAYEAAVADLPEGDDRPVLGMKLKNLAPFAGEYVQFSDTLEAALQDAQTTIDSAADIVVPADAAGTTPEADQDDTISAAEEASTDSDDTQPIDAQPTDVQPNDD